QRAPVHDAEGHSAGARGGGGQLVTVAHAGVELWCEAEDTHDQPEPAHRYRVRLAGRRARERIEPLNEGVARGGQRRGRRHFQDHLRERGGSREATEISGEIATQLDDVESRERLQLPRVLVIELRDAFAQRFERGAERTAGPEHTLGDGALDAIIARREPHDLRRLAVAVCAQNDGGCANKTHIENIADSRSSSPSTTRGPERLKYADASSHCTRPPRRRNSDV